MDDNDGSHATSKLSRVHRNASNMWDHFERLTNPATGTCEHTKCNYCGKVLSYKVTSGTSSMKKHLKRCTTYPHNIDKKQKQLSSKTCGNNEPNTLTTWKFDQEYCRMMLARCIIKDELPFIIVERDGFREFVHALQPGFKFVSRFTIARDCMKVYVSEKTSLRECLKSLNTRVALTTDIWTSIQTLSYLCLTSHFIDNYWKLHKRILSFVEIPSHKGKDIGKMVEACIQEWVIDDKVSTVTVDNASSNDVTITYLKGRLPNLVMGGDFLHMRCVAHILNLIVKDGLGEIKQSISRIRSAVRYVRSSPARAHQFKVCVERERISSSCKVCLDVSTRWNSTYLMLEAALVFQKAFDRMDDEDVAYRTELESDDGVPTWEDWQNAKVLARFLKKFYVVTKKLSGSLYVTSNAYVHDIVAILTCMNEWANESDPYVKSMCRKMKEKFDKYYGNVDKTNFMVLIAAVLDPRYKMYVAKFFYKRLFGNDSTKVNENCENLKGVLQRLFEFYNKGDNSRSYETSTSRLSQPSGIMEEFGCDGGNNDDIYIQDELMRFIRDEQDVEPKSELEKYFEEACEDGGKDIDILGWWKSNRFKYKILSQIARDVLAIPVSTVASESAFSTSGHVLDPFRSCLTPKVVQSLICTQDWLRSAPTPINIEELIEDAEKYDAEASGLTIVDDNDIVDSDINADTDDENL